MKYLTNIFLAVSLAGIFVLLIAPEAWAAKVRKYPPDVFMHLDQGSRLLEMRDYASAQREFESALKLESNCPEAYNNLGLTYYRRGNLVKASENYMKALEIEPLFVPSLSNLAAVRYQQNKYSDASNLYRLASRLANDKDAQIQYNLANVLRDAKDYTEAEVHYKEAVKLRPGFAAAHNGLGATYYCLSQFDKAEKEVSKAISISNSYSLAYYHLGLIKTAQNHPKAALAAYQKSLKYEKNKAYAKDTRQKIAELKAAQNKTLTSQTTAALSPSSSTDKVDSLLKTGQYGRAETLLLSLVGSSFKKDPSAWNSLGYAQLKQNKHAKLKASIKSFNRALELSNGGLIEAHYNLAQALQKIGKWISAKKECDVAISEARKQQKLCPLVHNLHGILLRHSGDYKGAENAYRIAIAQSLGNLPVAHYNRAIVLEKLQNTKEAVKEYRNYLRNAPKGANVDRAKRRLSMLGH